MLPWTNLAFFSLLAFVSAKTTCDASSALTPEQFVQAITPATQPASSDPSNAQISCIVYPDCPYCAQDPTAELCRSWRQTQLNDILNAGLVAGGNSFAALTGRSLQARATTLQCEDSEACVAASASFFLCIDPNSFNFKDSNGGSGNLDSDTYTMSNGEVTVVASTATEMPTPTGSGTKATTALATASAETTGKSATKSLATSTGTATATKTAASSTASAAGQSSASFAIGPNAQSLLCMAFLAVGGAAALL